MKDYEVVSATPVPFAVVVLVMILAWSLLKEAFE